MPHSMSKISWVLPQNKISVYVIFYANLIEQHKKHNVANADDDVVG